MDNTKWCYEPEVTTMDIETLVITIIKETWGERPFNDACFYCGEPGYMVCNFYYLPRRRQKNGFNNGNNGSGIVGQPHGITNQSSKNENNEAGKDMGYQYKELLMVSNLN